MFHPVIIGPRTRLAQELMARTSQRSKEFSKATIVARNLSEKVELESQFPQAAVVDCCEALPAHSPQRVALFVCALGPVKARLNGESSQVIAALERDVACLHKLWSRQTQEALSLVFVSSVLAWSSSSNRFLYSGAKRLGESALRDLASAHPETTFSVIYPGRLVTEKSWSKPTTLLATRYSAAADLMLDLVLHKKPQSRIVGWDARLLLFRERLTIGLRFTR